MSERKASRNFLAQLKKVPVNIDIIGYFKYVMTSEERQYVIPKLEKLALEKLFAHPFPPHFHQFCSGFNLLSRESKTFKEIAWYIESFIAFRQKTQSFPVWKEQVEKAILVGSEAQMNKALADLEDQLGLSYYLLLSELFINERFGGDNLEALADYVQEGLHESAQVLLEFGRCRIDKKISTWQYDTVVEVHKKLYDHLDGEEEKNYLEYIKFKLEINNYDKPLTQFPFILFFDSDLALMDRYDTLKKILPHLLLTNEFKDMREALTNQLERLYGITQDSFWLNAMLVMGGATQALHDERTEFYFFIHEAFFGSHWQTVIERVSERLKINPHHSELYLFFVKSIISVKDVLGHYLDEKTELYDILQLIKNVLEKKESYTLDREKLLKKYYSLSHFDFANVLLEVLYYEFKVTIPENVQLFAFFSARVLPYNFFNFIKDDRQLRQMVQSLERSSAYYRTITEFLERDVLVLSTTFQKRQSIINFLLSRGEYHKAIQVIDSVKEDGIEVVEKYDVTWLTKASLKCLIACRIYDRSAELIVDYYLENGNIYDHFIDENHVRDLAEVDNEVVLRNISIPITLHLFNVSHAELYDGLANFLVQYGFNVPSELLKIQEAFPKERVIYLLEKICKLEVIESSPFLNSIEQLEQERITILNALKQLNPGKQTGYNVEILSITKASSIRKGLKQIHESRIYVDTNSIEKKIEHEFQEYFNRYLEFDNTQNIDISTLSLNKSAIQETKSISYVDGPYIDRSTGIEQERYVVVEVPFIRYVYFFDMFNSVANAFVFDEDYGFKSYLSMRIRHGTFSNFLRNVFDKNNLISSKKRESDEYVDIQFWNEQIKEPAQKEAVQQLIKIFSREIDDIIDKGLSLINIRQNVQDVGVFNFIFSDEELRMLYYKRLGKITDVKTFMNEVFKILFDRLRHQLRIIRTFIDSELRTRFLSLLEELRKHVDVLPGSQQEKNLIVHHIVNCQTDIQVTTNQIRTWFNISKNQYIEAFTIDIVLDASLNYIDIISGKSLGRAEVITTNNCYEKFKGEYFEAFNDIFNNIFDNILKYNKELGSELKIYINIHCEEKQLWISVKNNLSDSIDVQLLQEKIKLISDRIKVYTSDTPVSYEQGSGYPKICKSIVVGLRRKQYQIELSTKEKEFEVNINFAINGLI